MDTRGCKRRQIMEFNYSNKSTSRAQTSREGSCNPSPNRKRIVIRIATKSNHVLGSHARRTAPKNSSKFVTNFLSPANKLKDGQTPGNYIGIDESTAYMSRTFFGVLLPVASLLVCRCQPPEMLRDEPII